MHNPSKGRPAAMWDRSFDFSQPLNPEMSRCHEHADFGLGYDLMYKDGDGKVRAKLDGLRLDEAAFLKLKHEI